MDSCDSQVMNEHISSSSEKEPQETGGYNDDLLSAYLVIVDVYKPAEFDMFYVEVSSHTEDWRVEIYYVASKGKHTRPETCRDERDDHDLIAQAHGDFPDYTISG
ncbi:hypothetical protein CUMW_074970 [Citrus unshiu]|nr:hypothetical protein CUMW_074970 [Citrus unshiu]